MKKLFKYTSPFLILLFLFAALGCEKEDEFSKEELLTAHVWRFSDITTNASDQGTIDLIELGKILLTGGSVNFDEDGTYAMISLFLDDPIEGIWELSSDKTTLTLDPGTTNSSINKLTSLTLTKMNWEEEESDGGETYTVSSFWIK